MVNAKKVAKDHFLVSQKKFEEHIASLEAKYVQQKMEECQDLHNAIVLLLTDKRATVQNALYVLEVIRFELLWGKFNEIAGNVAIPEDVLPLRKDIKENSPNGAQNILSGGPPTDIGAEPAR